MRRKFLLVMLVAVIALSTSACSFYVEFVFTNESKDEVQVGFEFGCVGEDIPGFHQATIKGIHEIQDNDIQWLDIPERVERRENCTVTALVLPGEALLLTRVDSRDVRTEKYPSGLKSLSINRQNGSVRYTGAEVFKSFTPEAYAWFPGAYMRYRIEAK